MHRSCHSRNGIGGPDARGDSHGKLPPMSDTDPRFHRALSAIDAMHDEDPERVTVGDETIGAELLYARRMTTWLERLAPDASPAVRLAVRAQHLRRWSIPRREYPLGKPGYHAWRTALGKLHAETAAEALRSAGYDDAFARRVSDLVRKKNLKTDPEAQLLEDVVCLVFLESYFDPFAAAHDDDALVEILRKTWPKMSSRGQQAALGLTLSDRGKRLVARALGG